MGRTQVFIIGDCKDGPHNVVIKPSLTDDEDTAWYDESISELEPTKRITTPCPVSPLCKGEMVWELVP